MPFPRPRTRPENLSAPLPDHLPKRVPGAALRAVPRVARTGPVEDPPVMSWRPRPPLGRPPLRDRIIAALRARLGQRSPYPH
jgi:hypothetical protein